MYVEAKFWDRVARKYAQDPIKNVAAYEATLDAVRSRLGAKDRVLEIGCGTGTTALALAGSTGPYTGADVSGGMIEIAREKLAGAGLPNLEFTVAPALETRFDAGSFDRVLAFNLLHLLADLPAALARVHQVLTPGGLFISKSPCLRQMGLHIRLILPLMKRFYGLPHLGTYRAQDLEDALCAAGFEIVEARAFDGAPNSWYVVARKI